ncbi:ribosome biogenesis protein [Holotrichia oblita]|uniref:Ribosome biogenesis protein n=1 Tax=Holotrichia oblita TaxID=644536 RepID=A0ACB9TMX3_HOLOL|nr:ribosome biogenesis protein [Holotrichia oblita]
MSIKSAAKIDSLYKEIVREPKVFKPLVIPKKLQHALPYRDKPNHGVKMAERRKKIDRVAVIKEPYEQKVSKVMKMIRTAYDHKQQHLRQKTKERLEKHRQMIQAVEANRSKKLKREKKEVFRIKSKTQIREEKKNGK